MPTSEKRTNQTGRTGRGDYAARLRGITGVRSATAADIPDYMRAQEIGRIARANGRDRKTQQIDRTERTERPEPRKRGRPRSSTNMPGKTPKPRYTPKAITVRAQLRVLRRASTGKSSMPSFSTIAKRSGLSSSFISLVFRGYRQPSLKSLRSIARTLGISLDALSHVLADYAAAS